jgi:hypothetical protein
MWEFKGGKYFRQKEIRKSLGGRTEDTSKSAGKMRNIAEGIN